jgi:Flp pilus assembly protein TadD
MRPEDGTAYRHSGYCFARRRRADEAIEMYKRAVELDDRDWEAHRGLGVAYMLKAQQSGESRWTQKAVEHWRRSLAIRPDQPKRLTLEKLIREHAKLENPLQGLND